MARAKVVNDMAVGAPAKDGDLAVGPRRDGLPEVDEVALDVVLTLLLGAGRHRPLDAEGGGAQREDVLQLRYHGGAWSTQKCVCFLI